MKTFKNKQFKERNYECSNVVACVGEKAPNENWIEVNEDLISKLQLQKLWIENNTQFYGWL